MINHHLTAAAAASCRQAADYRRALPERLASEQANVVRLTGWNEASVQDAMEEERARATKQ